MFRIGLAYKLGEQDQSYLLRIGLLVVVVSPSGMLVLVVSNKHNAFWWGGYRLVAAIG
jgi:hypothetical protein